MSDHKKQFRTAEDYRDHLPCEVCEPTVKARFDSNSFDPVQRPAHYNKHPSGIQTIELTRLCPGSLSNAIKYIWRAGEKNDIIEDMRKCVWYLDDYAASLDRGDAPPQVVGAGLVAQRVQDGRDGNLEGFLRALYGHEEMGGPWRFTTKNRVEIAKLFVEGAIAQIEGQRAMHGVSKR